eukprot:COSAG02_NODE_8811_length_2436_cov_1.494651_2_plen_161_part_00
MGLSQSWNGAVDSAFMATQLAVTFLSFPATGIIAARRAVSFTDTLECTCVSDLSLKRIVIPSNGILSTVAACSPATLSRRYIGARPAAVVGVALAPRWRPVAPAAASAPFSSPTRVRSSTALRTSPAVLSQRQSASPAGGVWAARWTPTPCVTAALLLQH